MVRGNCLCNKTDVTGWPSFIDGPEKSVPGHVTIFNWFRWGRHFVLMGNFIFFIFLYIVLTSVYEISLHGDPRIGKDSKSVFHFQIFDLLGHKDVTVTFFYFYCDVMARSTLHQK